jgi:hypothetical protein
VKNVELQVEAPHPGDRGASGEGAMLQKAASGGLCEGLQASGDARHQILTIGVNAYRIIEPTCLTHTNRCRARRAMSTRRLPARHPSLR